MMFLVVITQTLFLQISFCEVRMNRADFELIKKKDKLAGSKFLR